MKRLVVTLMLLLVAGCTASPIDFLIPTPSPSPATTEYLGHLYRTNNINMMYHSLSDTKLEKALITPRRSELEGLHAAARGELAIIDSMGTNASNMAWGVVTMALAAAGVMTPRPQEKHKVEAALKTPPPKAGKS